MADEELLAFLRQGVEAWNAWRDKHPSVRPDLSRGNLRGMNLYEVNLRWADLTEAKLQKVNLMGADLTGAKLRKANLTGTFLQDATIKFADLRQAKLYRALLTGADLGGADLRDVNLSDAVLMTARLPGTRLSGANCIGAKFQWADLENADLREVNLHEADLQRANLIDARLDGADLTGAKLWETQRGGWSIEGVVCLRAFWDRDGKEPTEYGDGEFERIFAEKPRIVLRYPGGLSPVDLAMLPVIVERLQVQHPGSKLHIRSLQDDAGAASVMITVEDLEVRAAEVFKAEVEALRADFTTVQQRLQQAEEVKRGLEAEYRGYQAAADTILGKLLHQADLSRQASHSYYITGPTTIEGTAMSRDIYNISGQAGAVGPNAHAHDNTFQQLQAGGIDLPKLAEELGRLRTYLRQEGKDEPEADEAIGAVAAAEKAAKQGDEAGVLRHLKAAGKWTLGIAEKVAVPLAVEVLKRTLPPG